MERELLGLFKMRWLENRELDILEGVVQRERAENRHDERRVFTVVLLAEEPLLIANRGESGNMDSIMYSVEYSYLLAYKVFLGVEFSTGLGGYANHVEGEARMFDRYQSHMVPVPEIMEKWLPRLGHVVS